MCVLLFGINYRNPLFGLSSCRGAQQNRLKINMEVPTKLPSHQFKQSCLFDLLSARDTEITGQLPQ